MCHNSPLEYHKECLDVSKSSHLLKVSVNIQIFLCYMQMAWYAIINTLRGLKVPYHWRFQHCPKVSRISMTEFCESRNFEGLYYFELLPLWWFLSLIRQSVDLQIGDRLRRLELDFTNWDSPLASNAVISSEVFKDIFFLANQKFYIR